MPIDPQGGGTWLAANDAGLVLAILNKSEPDVPAAGRQSRGVIIPELLAATTAAAARRAALKLDARRFRSFRLALIDGQDVYVVAGNGAKVIDLPVPPGAVAWCAASSGLGDEVVEPARVKLFSAIVVGARDVIAAQDDFHRHRWADRPHVSVDMMRDGAQTVSVTGVTVGGAMAEIVHEDRLSGAREAARLRLADAGVRMEAMR